MALNTGESLQCGPAVPLLELFDEIWLRESYRPTGWRQESPTVVDVGASVGVFSVWAARRLGAERLVAVEPSPESVAQLRRNLERNHVSAATVVQAALGGERRRAQLNRRGPSVRDTLYGHDVYGSSFEPAATVEVITLDDLFDRCAIESCDLLKLDCEGAEYEILYAAADVLERVRHISLEYHVGLNEHDPRSLGSYLAGLGFSVARHPPLDEEGGHLHASRES